MATRAKIHIARREEGVSFSEIPEKVIVSIYNHFDGYPEGLGVTLASYLEDKKITNGLGKDRYSVFNGLGCMAASIIAELKDEAGQIYIEDPTRPHGWIDYEYYVWGDDGKDIWISIFDGSNCIFVGKPTQLLSKYYTD
tara:strand:- start:55 stop:471 length:417 start_codon:yes stop_codon:yes gene_type:complete